MVSTRRSGDLSGNNSTTTPNGSSSKRCPISSEDKPQSPKRQKLEDSGASIEKPAATAGDQTVAEETSKENCMLPPADSGECDAALISGDAKVESSPAATAAQPPVTEGSTPTLVEKPISSFSGWKKYPKQYSSQNPWCKLLSQSGQDPSLSIYTSSFSIGSSGTCNFKLRDPTASGTLCKITRNQYSGAALLEVTGSKGSVLYNGIPVKKNFKRLLQSGDEVVFGSLGSYAFIFQKMSDVAVKGGGHQMPAGNFLQLERKAVDPSAVTDASILASLPSFSQDLSRLKSSSHASTKSHQATSVVPGGAELRADGMERNVSVDIQSNKAANGEAISSQNHDSNMEILDEKSELTRNSQQASTSGHGLRSAIFREGIQAGIVEGKSLEVSFENFPYYLSENTKNVLIAASHIHLKQKEYAKYASDLTTLNPRILVSGPAGSEIYQEMLAKALANYFEAKLLIFDSHPILGALTAKEIESLKDGLASDKSCTRSRQSLELIDRGKSSDLSAGEGDASSPSPAASSCPDSQPKLKARTLPCSFGTPGNHTLKKGMPF